VEGAPGNRRRYSERVQQVLLRIVPQRPARAGKTRRRRDIEAAFRDHCRQAGRQADLPAGLSEQRRQLIIPHAVSDCRTTFATVDLVRLIDHLRQAGPQRPQAGSLAAAGRV